MEKAPAKYEPAATLIQRANAVIFSHQFSCLYVCVGHTLPSPGNLPRVSAQWPELPCSSSRQSRVSPPQVPTIHSRWQNLRTGDATINKETVFAGFHSMWAFACVLYSVSPWGWVPPSCVGTSALVLLDCRGSAWCPGTWTDSVRKQTTLFLLCTFKRYKEMVFYINSHTFTSRYKHAATDSFSMLSPCLKAGSWQDEITLV